MAGLQGESVRVRVVYAGAATFNPVTAQGTGVTEYVVFEGDVVVGAGVELSNIAFGPFIPINGGPQLGFSGSFSVDLSDTGYTVSFAGTAQPFSITFQFSNLADESIGSVTGATEIGNAGITNGVNATRPPLVDSSVVTSGFTLLGFQPGTSVSQTVSFTYGPPPANPPGSVSIANAQVTEGDNGTTQVTFTLTRTGGTAPFSIDVATAAVNGGATAGTDFVAASQTISFADGQDTATFTVTINNDQAAEANETFEVRLTNATNGVNIAQGGGSGIGVATGTIVDNDLAGSVSIANASVTEGDSGARDIVFTLTRAGGDAPFSIDVATLDVPGGALSGVDYVARSTTINFAAGQTTASFAVSVTGDQTFESNEAFRVELTNATNGVVLTQGGGSAAGVATGMILNDDTTGLITIAGGQRIEGNDGSSFLTFTLNRSGGSAPFTVDAATRELVGDARAGVDFEATSQTISFAANQNSATFAVRILADRTPENDETFQVELSNVTNGGTLSTATANGTIVNDDAGFSIGNLTVTEGNDPLLITSVAISRDPVFSGFATTLYARPVSGTASAGSDFSLAQGAISFAIGQSTTFFTVLIPGDRVAESDEQFTVELYLDAAFTQQIGVSTVTILNDDGDVQRDAFGPGNDLLTANNPASDTLSGGAGNDQYVVNSIDDVIIEDGSGGIDTVYAATSYSLNGGSFVEVLSTQTHAGTDPINLIGNFHAQQIIGNFGDNILNGNGGVDTLIGLDGNDTYVVGDSAAQIIEEDGRGFDSLFAGVSYALADGVSIEAISAQTAADTFALNLTGNGFAQTIAGNMGANVLDGGLGADTLTGLGGADTFAFSTAIGGGNVDVIADFVSGTDRIQLSASVFSALGGGSVPASAFALGGTATTALHRILYDQASGQLFYDPDGLGAAAAILFAQLAPGTALTPIDLIVV